jgi:TM2 domain-containing membrane protein YozV
MIKKKNKFLTFVFSMLPGAGQMYLGFMKIGLSFMSVFFFLIFLSSLFDTGQLLFIAPLIWFYSFFDCTNRASLNEEQLLLLEDKYLFSLDKLVKIDKDIFEKRRLIVGGVLLFLGVYLVIDNAMNILEPYMSRQIYNIIDHLMRQAPQVIIGVAIVALGVRLIMGKKRECERDA